MKEITVLFEMQRMTYRMKDQKMIDDAIAALNDAITVVPHQPVTIRHHSGYSFFAAGTVFGYDVFDPEESLPQYADMAATSARAQRFVQDAANFGRSTGGVEPAKS